MLSRRARVLESLLELFGIVAILALTATRGAAQETPVDTDGTIHLPAVALPESSLLSEATRRHLAKAHAAEKTDAKSSKHCPSIDSTDRNRAATAHRCETDAFRESDSYRRLRNRYSVEVRAAATAGVRTEIFTPAQSIAPRNRNRVLINVHGGGFLGGWGTNSVLESIPIAAVAGIKVISVDYREAPEDIFPAASDDVVKVYRTLLKTYSAKNIGLYGSSAGALLGAESVALMLKQNLPVPGGVGLFCGGASYYSEGDSGYLGSVVYGGTAFGRMVWGNPTANNPYFKNVDPKDPLAFPAVSQSVISKFPPTLVIAGIRDPALSSALQTHAALVELGVETDLHVWEGMGHTFFYDVDLPESKEAYRIIAKFFDSHLGK